jgi:hypothetical protein
MSSNKLVINVTGTTHIEVNYSGTVLNIETAVVSFNGSQINAKKRFKSHYAYVSHKSDEIYLLINKRGQFKVTYKDIFKTKGNLNSGPVSLNEIESTEELSCDLSDE